MKKILDEAYQFHICPYQTLIDEESFEPLVEQTAAQIRATVHENEINKLHIIAKGKGRKRKNITPCTSSSVKKSGTAAATARAKLNSVAATATVAAAMKAAAKAKARAAAAMADAAEARAAAARAEAAEAEEAVRTAEVRTKKKKSCPLLK